MRTNRLKNTICYLCGPMDRVADGGVIWRRYITPILKRVGVGVLDPSDKPTHCGRRRFFSIYRKNSQDWGRF